MVNTLRHVGVLGMRWGHRKSSSTSTSNKNHKWAKSPISDKAFEEDLDKIMKTKMTKKQKEKEVSNLVGIYQLNRANEIRKQKFGNVPKQKISNGKKIFAEIAVAGLTIGGLYAINANKIPASQRIIDAKFH